MVTIVKDKEMRDIKPGEIPYFLKAHKFPLQEGQVIEFKGHRNISEDNVPDRAVHMENGSQRSSRTPAARALNSFVNQTVGGFLYLGITDDREAHGFKLSPDQREHVRQQVYHLLTELCEPPVRRERVEVNFIPVVGSEAELRGVSRAEELLPPCDSSREHVLLTQHYCWCDKETVGELCRRTTCVYVVEVLVRAVTAEDRREYARYMDVSEDLMSPPEVTLWHMNEDERYYERTMDSSRLVDEVDVMDRLGRVFQANMEREGERHEQEVAQLEGQIDSHTLTS